MKLPTTIIAKFLLSVGIILIFSMGYYFFIMPKEIAQVRFNVKDWSIAVDHLANDVNQRWQMGDIENNISKKVFECNDLISNSEQVDSEYSKCNPYYLKCFMQGKAGNKAPIFKYKVDGKQYTFKSVNSFKYDQLSNPTIIFEEQSNKRFVKFKLLNTCRDTYLPQKRFSAGPKSINKFEWDNLGRHYYIDKFYVTNRDIHEWFNRTGVITSIKVADFPKPSTSLNLQTRKDYCKSVGKKILESRFFDAAVYIPNENSTSMHHLYKYPYPWTKSRNSFLSSVYYRKNKHYELQESECLNAYIKGCEIFPYRFGATVSVTWMGIYNAMGHYLESFENKFVPKGNIKVSSSLFDKDSLWHANGMRGYWDYKNGIRYRDQYNEITKTSSPIAMGDKKIEVAFRCMVQR